MYLVLIAWFYVALMVSVAEAASPSGTLLGALVTFVLYGLLPMGIVGYILNTPARKKARQQVQQAQAQTTSLAPDERRHAASDPITPVRKEH